MRNSFSRSFYDAARSDERLCAVVADISPAGAMDEFRRDYPARFVNTGVAEQIMIGMCAGMAMRGLRPFAYTIAPFALFRPYEFIRNDLCYQGLPVTVVGVGGGVAYSTLGGTHHAMEDVAIASALPNMRVLAPCDPLEVAAATQWCAAQGEGPVYLRLGKAGEQNLSTHALPFEFGKLRFLRQGADACVLGYGPILKLAMEAAEEMQRDGVSVSVVSAHTLKPLDREGIARLLARFRRVVVLEEMVAQGGLGEAVKAIAWESAARCNLHCLGLKSEFLHVYGTHDQVLAAHGLTVRAVRKRLFDWIQVYA